MKFSTVIVSDFIRSSNVLWQNLILSFSFSPLHCGIRRLAGGVVLTFSFVLRDLQLLSLFFCSHYNEHCKTVHIFFLATLINKYLRSRLRLFLEAFRFAVRSAFTRFRTTLILENCIISDISLLCICGWGSQFPNSWLCSVDVGKCVGSEMMRAYQKCHLVTFITKHFLSCNNRMPCRKRFSGNDSRERRGLEVSLSSVLHLLEGVKEQQKLGPKHEWEDVLQWSAIIFQIHSFSMPHLPDINLLLVQVYCCKVNHTTRLSSLV